MHVRGRRAPTTSKRCRDATARGDTARVRSNLSLAFEIRQRVSYASEVVLARRLCVRGGTFSGPWRVCRLTTIPALHSSRVGIRTGRPETEYSHSARGRTLRRTPKRASFPAMSLRALAQFAISSKGGGYSRRRGSEATAARVRRVIARRRGPCRRKTRRLDSRRIAAIPSSFTMEATTRTAMASEMVAMRPACSATLRSSCGSRCIRTSA